MQGRVVQLEAQIKKVENQSISDFLENEDNR